MQKTYQKKIMLGRYELRQDSTASLLQQAWSDCWYQCLGVVAVPLSVAFQTRTPRNLLTADANCWYGDG